MTESSARRRPRNAVRDGASLLVLLTSAVACEHRGIVGVTASTSSGRDAMPDATRHLDAGRHPDATVRADATTGGNIFIDDCLPTNTANLSPAVAQQLIDGSGDTTSMRFLYPYDGTVYPRGIPGPVLMWDGPASDVVYVRLHSSRFDYRGCLKPSAPNRLQLPSGIWDQAAASTNGAGDPFTLDLKLLAAEAVHGPISEQLVIARGALTGSVYYMSYTPVGGIFRVRAGGAAEAALTPLSCAGCHSISANGARMLAFSSGVGSSFTLSASSSVPAPLSAAPGAEFAGVYPDGSVYVASAHPTSGGGPMSRGGGVTSSALYDTATGALIDGSAIPTGACMPMFSPDGQQLTFSDLGPSLGHTLASMRFSIATRAASAYQTLFSSQSTYIGWPSFLPDGDAVVFAQGAAADFSGGNVGLIPVVVGPATDLFIVDVTTKTTTLLAQAMGFRSIADVEAQKTYLPGGTADLHQSYYPTVSAIPSGGYAWVFFDSARSYGNQGAHRQIWGAALTIAADGSYLADPSHPAFYLPGQDANTPNFRAAAVPDP
jgi:hypothetical protein